MTDIEKIEADNTVETMTQINMQEVNFDSADESEMKGKYLTFWIEKQLFGVPIKDVLQIIEVQQIIDVPEYPSYAKGIINLRGVIVPVIDIRLRFSKPEAEYTARTCIIVTKMGENTFGFIVDSVNEVAEITDENISAPPNLDQSAEQGYLLGIGRQGSIIVLLLDTQKIIGEDDRALLAQE